MEKKAFQTKEEEAKSSNATTLPIIHQPSICTDSSHDMNPLNLFCTIPFTEDANTLPLSQQMQHSSTVVMNLAIHINAFYSLPSHFSTLNYITANVCMLITTIDKSKFSELCVLIRLKWSSSTVLNHFKQS